MQLTQLPAHLLKQLLAQIPAHLITQLLAQLLAQLPAHLLAQLADLQALVLAHLSYIPAERTYWCGYWRCTWLAHSMFGKFKLHAA